MSYAETMIDPATRPMIINNRGSKFDALPENILVAMNEVVDLPDGIVTLPPIGFNIDRLINLPPHAGRLTLKGSGPFDTILNFATGTRIQSKDNAYLSNLDLRDFAVTGHGNLQLFIKDHLLVDNVRIYDLMDGEPGAIRILFTQGSHDVVISNVNTDRTWSHGLIFNTVEDLATLSDVQVFDSQFCRAGWKDFPGFGPWSCGIDLCERYANAIPHHEGEATIENFLLQNVTTYRARESGVSIETYINTYNVVFRHCASYANGIDKADARFATGFVGHGDMHFVDCTSSYNKLHGFRLGQHAAQPAPNTPSLDSVSGIQNGEKFIEWA